MKRENKTESSLFYEKHLFSFYLKKRILSIKFIGCIILSLIILFSIINEFESQIIINQKIVDEEIYWQYFIVFLSKYLRFVPVIFVADIVSEEFSSRAAMIIYATESRTKIISIKLLSLMTSILILLLFYFSTFLIFNFLMTELFVSIPIFLTGFLIIFIDFLFFSSLIFMISAFTLNVVPSLILPLFYIIIEVLFIMLLEEVELELLSYSSYEMKVIDLFENLIFNKEIIFSSLTIISSIVFFGLPALIILIIFHHFKRIDIRVD
ncbi:hypothetical protein LCGC14_2061820 [marine sediment metagenome]|uniref:ABC-2 type transporter domain-containing protein n=1 Tax=marine sediment metagenome TaxID=412755 RepID=A0A0F9EKY3_9ZZZZ